jgi:hypothetical protein
VVQSTAAGAAVVDNYYTAPILFAYPLNPNNYALTSAKLKSVIAFSPKKNVELPASKTAL